MHVFLAVPTRNPSHPRYPPPVRSRLLLAVLALSLLANIAAAFALRNTGLKTRVLRGLGLAAPAPQRDRPFATDAGILRTVYPATPRARTPLLLFGDSLVAYGAWTETLDARALNRGVPGDTVALARARLAEITRHDAEKVLVAIGINDVLQGVPPATIASSYDALLRELRAAMPSSRIYVQAVLPTRRAALAEPIRELNAALADVARRNGAELIPAPAAMSDSAGLLRADLALDDVHLDGSGYRVWRDGIRAAIGD